MRRAVQLRPGDAELQLQLGKDLQSVGEVAAAEEAYQLAIDLRFDFWEGYYYLGYAEYVRGHYEATANAWRIAARCAPGRSNLFSNLGAVYHYLDRTADATRMFERAIGLSDRSDGVAFSNLGTLYFESGRYAEAVATFQKALAIDDDDYRIWGYLGWSYAAGVDPSRAIEPFERATELAEQALADDPDNPDMMADLAGYLGKLGHDQQGLELIEQAISFDPQDPDVMASIGETLEDLGDRDRALEWIGRALAGGARRSKIESHPSLRDFVADPRYQELVTTLVAGQPENR
jgi:tetratricopeptide (TPR) repeat protein